MCQKLKHNYLMLKKYQPQDNCPIVFSNFSKHEDKNSINQPINIKLPKVLQTEHK